MTSYLSVIKFGVWRSRIIRALVLSLLLSTNLKSEDLSGPTVVFTMTQGQLQGQLCLRGQYGVNITLKDSQLIEEAYRDLAFKKNGPKPVLSGDLIALQSILEAWNIKGPFVQNSSTLWYCSYSIFFNTPGGVSGSYEWSDQAESIPESVRSLTDWMLSQRSILLETPP